MAKRSRSAEGNQPALAGFHAVGATLRRNPAVIEVLWIDRTRRDRRMASIAEIAARQGVEIRRVDREELDSIGNGMRHQGLLAHLRPGVRDIHGDLPSFLDSLEHDALILVLDQVQDPHNLGACLRSADGAGVDAVILPKDGAAPVTDTVRRVAAGAAEQVPLFYVTNLSRTLEGLKQHGIWIYGTAESGDSTIFEADLSGSVALVMGGEGGGMRRLVSKTCDRVVRIPMTGSVSSLNVSVAAGVILFEARRQRMVAALS